MSRPEPAPWERSPLADPGFSDEPLMPEFERFMAERLGQTPSVETQKRYRRHFAYFTEWLAATGRSLTMSAVCYVVLREYGRYLATRPARGGTRGYDRPQRGMSPETRDGYLRDLRTLCSFLVEARWLVSNPFKITRPERLIRKQPRTSPPPQRVAGPERVDALLAVIEGDAPSALRDRALVEVLWSAGLRRRDVAALRLDQLDPERGVLRDVWEHKDHEERHCSISAAALDALLAYLAAGRPTLVAAGTRRGADDPGWLFISDHHGKRNNPDGRLTGTGIYQMLCRYSRRAGIPTVAPHAMRHGMSTVMGEANLSQHLIAAKLGHRQTKTSERYLHPSAEVLRREVDPIIDASRQRTAQRLRSVA